MNFRKEYNFDSFVRLLILTVLIVGVFFILKYLSPVLLPFAVALLLAYLLNPIVMFFEKYLKWRSLAVWLTLFLLVLVIVLIINIVGPKISKEFTETAEIITRMLKTKPAFSSDQTLFASIWQHIQNFFNKPDIQNIINANNFVNLVSDLGQKVFPGVWGLIAGTANFLVGILVVLVVILYLVFILFDYDMLRQQFNNLIPKHYKSTVTEFILSFEKAMNQYFRAQMLVALSVGILFAIGFSIINLPLAIVLGLFVGILNLVPYLQAVGFVPAVLLAVVGSVKSGMPFWQIFLLVCLVFVVVQTIQEILLVPRIMRKMTGLRPAVVLLSLSVWGKLLGFFGLVIAIPFTCLILAYYQKFIDEE
ncbi:MAG: AI-2E family transporter [bacterium]|nr:AI-2E family transporter [bacterium]